MTNNGYWTRFTHQRLSRRRALQASGGIGLGAVALSLIGCGGDDDPAAPTEPVDQSGLLSTPVDTTSDAVAGGTLRDFQHLDMHHFDPVALTNNPVTNFVAVFAYPRLLKFKSATYPNAADGSSEGEAAIEWEMDPGHTQLTMKLRQGMKWDARPPTNGRTLDAQDVLFSWEKYGSLNASAQDLVYNPDSAPGAPIESVSAPDDHTIVMRLRQFDSSLIQLLTAWDHFYIMPIESDGQFDPQTEIRGHGPWLLDEYVPSASVKWRKNPDYYVPNRPFPDFIERPIVTDYTQRLAQFRAGNVWTTVAGPEDVVQMKRDAPATLLRRAANFGTSVSQFITFGYEGDSPFKDVRMRRALSMMIDREAFADVIENRDGFRREGLELEVGWNTIVAPGQVGYWLDPMDEDRFGPNHAFLKYDLEEAQKLVRAAGHSESTEFKIFHALDGYGADYFQTLDVMEGFMLAGGLRPVRDGTPYAFYRDHIYDTYLASKFGTDGFGVNGIIHRQVRGFPTVAAGLFGMMHPDGGFYHGATPDGNNVHLGDPELNSLIQRIKAEPDTEQQQSLVHDAIRHVTGQVYNIPRPSNPKPFSNWWPAIGNVGLNSTFAGGNIWVEERLNWWIDTSKAPLA